MLRKLALTGIKSRLKDYIVLFSGLVIASAIFYMFESLATNQAFIKHNATIGSAAVIFQIGSVLLAIITLVYILYANSFLMTMRQHDYATFMMLGAKSKKIGQLIFIETMVVGFLATVVGILIGTGLTYGVGMGLIDRLGATIHNFQPFYLPAMLITLIFFLVLFFVAALINRHQLLKKSILSLLKVNNTPTRFKYRPILWAVEAILGVLLLGIGYWAMASFKFLLLSSIPIAVVTIVLGSYFVFNALVVWVLFILRRSNIAKRGLNGFTIAQLTFRVRDYTRFLAMISIVFALALGAITVGMGFYNQIPEMTKQNGTAYDLVLHDPQQAELRDIKELDVKKQETYSYKFSQQTIYFPMSQFQKNPLDYSQVVSNGDFGSLKVKSATLKELQTTDSAAYDDLNNMLLPNLRRYKIQFINEAHYKALPQTAHQFRAIQVKDFKADLPTIEKIYKLQAARFPQIQTDNSNRYVYYQLLNGLLSGFEFMGFFLGIAFLAMLASTLMFKILSGAASDVARYNMLNKIGTRKRLLHRAIDKEVGILFLLPGILGIIHVLFGLQLFKAIMMAPYYHIWIPFSVFVVLYAIYYLVTVKLYQGIVLKK